MRFTKSLLLAGLLLLVSCLVSCGSDGGPVVESRPSTPIVLENYEKVEVLTEITLDDSIAGLDWSTDGNSLAAASGNQVHILAVFGPQTKSLTLDGHTESVRAVAYDPSGTRLASASNDGTARLWDSTTGKQLGVFEVGDHSVQSVAFSPDGKILAGAGGAPRDGGRIWLWDMNSDVELEEITPAEETVFALQDIAWSPNGAMFGSAGATAQVFDKTSFDRIAHMTISTGSAMNRTTYALQNLAWSPDGSVIAFSSASPSLDLWQTSDWKTTQLDADGQLQGVAWSPEGMLLASGSKAGTVHLWDLVSEKNAVVFDGLDGRIELAWSPNGTALAAGDSEGTIVVLGIP